MQTCSAFGCQSWITSRCWPNSTEPLQLHAVQEAASEAAMPWKRKIDEKLLKLDVLAHHVEFKISQTCYKVAHALNRLHR